MFEIRPSKQKKYQQYAAIGGSTGLVLGIIIPVVGIMLFGWRCPFGIGILPTVGFSILTGVCGAFLLGNLMAFLLIGLAKFQLSKNKINNKEGDLNGNRNIRS